MEGKAIILSAPSGSGKTTLIQHLLKQGTGLEFSISATSRTPRGNEKNGVDYYFLSAKEFKKRIEKSEFIEWEEVYEDMFYGTLKSELERIWEKGKHVIFDVDVLGGVNLKKILGNQALSVFVMPPSVEELEKRLKKRGTDSDEKIKKRMERASYEMGFSKQFDVQIINDDLEKAQEQTLETIKNFLHGH